jgi:hypothetical protein
MVSGRDYPLATTYTAGNCVTNLCRARSLLHLLLAEKQKMGVSDLYRIEWMISE